eukprot:365697-Chlamydomonas_euryale.AAC.11
MAQTPKYQLEYLPAAAAAAAAASPCAARPCPARRCCCCCYRACALLAHVSPPFPPPLPSQAKLAELGLEQTPEVGNQALTAVHGCGRQLGREGATGRTESRIYARAGADPKEGMLVHMGVEDSWPRRVPLGGRDV